MGPQVMTAQILKAGDGFSGTMSSPQMEAQKIAGKISGTTLTWSLSVTKPMSIKLGFDVRAEGDRMTGPVKLGMFGKADLTGKRM
jgi:hypothetical protein